MSEWGTRNQAEQVAMVVQRHIDEQWGPRKTVGDVLFDARGALISDRKADQGSDIMRDADYYLCARTYTANHKYLWPVIVGSGFALDISYNAIKVGAITFDFYVGGHHAGKNLESDEGNPNSLPGGFKFFIFGRYDGVFDSPGSAKKPTVPVCNCSGGCSEGRPAGV